MLHRCRQLYPHHLQRSEWKKKCRCWYFIILSAAHMLCRSILANSTKEYQGFKRTYTHKVSLSSENQPRIMLSPWLIILQTWRPKIAAIDVFQVPWITSIDGFDKSRKPLVCNGRRWVFPFCNVLRAKLGTEAFWTRGYWLGPDNGT